MTVIFNSVSVCKYPLILYFFCVVQLEYSKTIVLHTFLLRACDPSISFRILFPAYIYINVDSLSLSFSWKHPNSQQQHDESTPSQPLPPCRRCCISNDDDDDDSSTTETTHFDRGSSWNYWEKVILPKGDTIANNWIQLWTISETLTQSTR
jgi:hypothetical protein